MIEKNVSYPSNLVVEFHVLRANVMNNYDTLRILCVVALVFDDEINDVK